MRTIARDAKEAESKLDDLSGYLRLLQRVCSASAGRTIGGMGGVLSTTVAQTLKQSGFRVLQVRNLICLQSKERQVSVLGQRVHSATAGAIM